MDKQPEPEYLEGEFDTGGYQMVSGIADQQAIEFYCAKEVRPGYWYLWADVPNSGDHIYCGSTKQKEEGFGGRTMIFPIGKVEGETVELKLLGPWHTNGDDLFNKTGVDLRDKHHTWGCIAEEQDNEGLQWPRYKYTKLIHVDREPVLGKFRRIQTLAEELTARYRRPLYYHDASRGGSSSGRTVYKPDTEVELPDTKD